MTPEDIGAATAERLVDRLGHTAVALARAVVPPPVHFIAVSCVDETGAGRSARFEVVVLCASGDPAVQRRAFEDAMARLHGAAVAP